MHLWLGVARKEKLIPHYRPLRTLSLVQSPFRHLAQRKKEERKQTEREDTDKQLARAVMKGVGNYYQ